MSRFRFLPIPILVFILAACGGGSSGGSTSGGAAENPTPVEEPGNPVEPPAPDPNPDPDPDPDPDPEPEPLVVRPIGETAGDALLRLAPNAYADGVSALAGPDRPSARAVSNAVCAQEESTPDADGRTDFVWQWGQFVDHDISLTPEAEPAEPADIPVPAFDSSFDPEGTGEVFLHLLRSEYVPGSEPRQQVNALTSFIDASNVYGSDSERVEALRTLDGTGRLKTSDGDLLPKNEAGLPNAGGIDAALYLAGDVRANEQVGLLAMHTLFVREHNRLAAELARSDSDLTGDEIYERARRVVGALMQVITYEEFLPALLGPEPLPRYEGHDANVDPRISNEFSTGAYRLGHSMLSPAIQRIDGNGDEIEQGHLALRDAFFNPGLIAERGDLDPVLRGLAAQTMQAVDTMVVDDVRNFLFGPPGAGGLDLAALNIQRGRDHGLPSLNGMRQAYGLPRIASFEALATDGDTRERLRAVYATVEDVDAWVGGLAETDLPGATVGECLSRILSDQFVRLRDGDPYWYERTFSGAELDELRRTRLADVIRRNTEIGAELSDDVFRSPQAVPAVVPPPPAPVDDGRRRRIQDRFGG